MNGARIIASPYARALAREKGIDLTAQTGSGPGGRIIARDLLRLQPVNGARPGGGDVGGGGRLPDPRRFFAPDSYREVKLTPMRRAIARRLSASFAEIPHFAIAIDCEVDALLELRKRINAATDLRLSVNDCIMRAAALALSDAPDVHVSFAGDAILRHEQADISFALALPGGLVTPIVRNVGALPVARISSEIRRLSELGRKARLAPADYEGGTFTVSNLGMYGVRAFTAIINPPQSAALTVGAAQMEAGRKRMCVTLCCDHRAIDGAAGAQFLQALRGLIEAPILLFT